MSGYLRLAKQVPAKQKTSDVAPKVSPSWRECTLQEARKEVAAYQERGWIAIYSEVLREPIILARDEEAARRAPEGFVTYTESEVALLLTAAPDELRQVHEVKRHFGGRVVERRSGPTADEPGEGGGNPRE